MNCKKIQSKLAFKELSEIAPFQNFCFVFTWLFKLLSPLPSPSASLLFRCASFFLPCFAHFSPSFAHSLFITVIHRHARFRSLTKFKCVELKLWTFIWFQFIFGIVLWSENTLGSHQNDEISVQLGLAASKIVAHRHTNYECHQIYCFTWTRWCDKNQNVARHRNEQSCHFEQNLVFIQT